ncbi:MAG TPA: ATP-dependent zinc metalloprotease FtsH [Longimicrobiales bacterium]
MPDREGNRNRGGNRWSRLSRTFSFWILVFLIPVLAIQLMAPRDQDAAELTYTEFVAQLRDDNVREVTVVGGRKVDGSLRAPIRVENRTVERFHTLLPFPDNQALLAELEERGVQIRAEEPRQNWWGLVVAALPWVLIIAFWLFLIRQMQAGGNKAFQFGKSKARLLTADTPKVTFADVAGADEAKDELQEIIEFLKDPQRFSRLGGRLPKGVLLVGPPGTGKTLMARAVAGEAGVPFFSISGSEFVEMFVGVGASRVRDLFEQAKRNSPCIVFVDEIDAVGRQRGAGLGGSHDEREQTLNQILVEMDGFDTNTNVIVVAATNRPDVLDPALLRPGRFDRQVVLDRPDIKGRKEILNVHIKGKPLDKTVDIEALARRSPGFSGADLANLVNEAAILAARRNKKSVGMAEFNEAIDRVIAGPERRSRIITEEEKEIIAYHEGGHAVVQRVLPKCDPVTKVTIVSRGMALGYTMSLPQEDRYLHSKSEFEDKIAGMLGGNVSETLVFGDTTTGSSNDIEKATNLARAMVTQYGMSEKLGPLAFGKKEEMVFLGREISEQRNYSDEVAAKIDAEVRAIIDRGFERAREALTKHRDILDKLAALLVEKETIEHDEFESLFEGVLPPRSGGPSLRRIIPEADAPQTDVEPDADTDEGGRRPSPAPQPA